MATARNLEEIIVTYRKEGKSYREIQALLNCSKRTINYHCENNNLLDTGKKRYPITLEKQKEIFEFCKTNSDSVAKQHLNVSLSTIRKFKNGDFLKPTE